MVVAVTAGIFGLALIAHGLRFWLKGRASWSWPEVTASRSTAVVLQDKSGDVPVYRPSVRYAYRFDGTEYEGDTAFFGDRFWIPWAGHLQGRVNVIGGRGSFPIRVNPRNPRESVVEPGVHWHSYAAALTGVGFLTWALWIAIR